MAQRTGRKVSDAVPHVKAHGKKAKAANAMQPGIPEAMRLGDQDPSDSSKGNDGSKAAAAAPGNAHRGPLSE